MTKILFICWGNICRSPAAELIFTDMVRREGLESKFFAASAGISDEEDGNPVYPPMRHLLYARGIDCSAKRARKYCRSDYQEYDLLICMDEVTNSRTRRFFDGDPDNKVRNLLDYAGRIGEEIDDPWYTRDFEKAMAEIDEGCRALLTALTEPVTLDLSSCADRSELYAVLREGMGLPVWAGSNLDALWDMLSSPEQNGKSYRMILPSEENPLFDYASRVREVFREADALAE